MEYLWKLLNHDLREQVIKHWYYFLIILPLIIYLCIDFQSLLKVDDLGESPDFMDMVIYLFYGVKEYIPDQNPFQVKIEFMLIHIIPAYIIAYYPVKDLSVSGRQIFIRVRNNNIWWYSKCIWLILVICLYYLTIFACSAIIAGNVNMVPQAKVLLHIGEIQGLGSGTEYFCYLIILPVLTTIAVSFVQMFLSVITAPVYGFLLVVLNLLLSSYFYSHWLPGNFLMFNRSLLARDQGIGLEQALVIDAIFIVISVIAGGICMKKKDIL